MNQNDKKLFYISDKLAKKYYKILYTNHREVMTMRSSIEDRIRNISNVFFWLFHHVTPIMRYLESSSERKIPKIPIEKILIKEFYTAFLHPTYGWQQLFHQSDENGKYHTIKWRNLNPELRNKLKLYYKDITSITTSYILFETGGYIDKRAAQQMEWIDK